MIKPGAIYRTRSGRLLLAVQVKKREKYYSLWSARCLNESMKEVIMEDYWLENQEKLA